MNYLQQAIQLATSNAETGGGPFGAVILFNGITFTGVNQVTELYDPTAHAEVQAIRAACDSIESHDLTGAVLYTSCQPCPMCLTAALWSRLDRIVYAATDVDATAYGFDDSTFYDQVSDRLEKVTDLATVHQNHEDRLLPFKTWDSNSHKRRY